MTFNNIIEKLNEIKFTLCMLGQFIGQSDKTRILGTEASISMRIFICQRLMHSHIGRNPLIHLLDNKIIH